MLPELFHRIMTDGELSLMVVSIQSAVSKRVVCGWLVVVYGWPGCRLRMARNPIKQRGDDVPLCIIMAVSATTFRLSTDIRTGARTGGEPSRAQPVRVPAVNPREFTGTTSSTRGETAGGTERYTNTGHTALRPRSLLTGRSFWTLKSIPELMSLDCSLVYSASRQHRKSQSLSTSWRRTRAWTRATSCDAANCIVWKTGAIGSETPVGVNVHADALWETLSMKCRSPDVHGRTRCRVRCQFVPRRARREGV